MNWKHSSMQQLRKTTTWLSGFSRLTRLPTFATTVLRKPTKVHTSYTAKMFEIREYHLCHPEASFENIADTFGMPKTTIFNDKPSVEPAQGRGNRKCTRRLLSYPQETEQQLVCLHVYVNSKHNPCISCWPCNIFAGSFFEMKDLHLSVLVVLVKEKLDTIQKHIPGFKASDYSIYKFFRRNHFTLRANTSLSQMLPANLEGKIRACLQKVQEEGSIGRFPCIHSNRQWMRSRHSQPWAKQVNWSTWCKIMHHSDNRHWKEVYHSCSELVA